MKSESQMPAHSTSKSQIPEKHISSSGNAQRSTAGSRFSFDRRLVPPVFAIILLTTAALWTMWQGYLEPAEPPVATMPRWWVSPIEFNSTLRLPVIEGNLNCVHSTPDGRKIWVVGDGGLILHSSDAGRTWVRQGENVSVEPVPPVAAAPAEEPAPAPAPAKPADEKKGEAPAAKVPAAAAAAERTRTQVFAQIPPEKLEVLLAADKTPDRRVPVDAGQQLAQNPAVQQNLGKQPNAADKQVPPAAAGGRAAGVADNAAAPAVQVRYRNWFGIAFDATGMEGFAICYSGTVIRTKDGGKTWETTQSIPPAKFGYATLFGLESGSSENICIWSESSALVTSDLGISFEPPNFRIVAATAAPPNLPLNTDRGYDGFVLDKQEVYIPPRIQSFRRRIQWNITHRAPGFLKEVDLNVDNTVKSGQWYVGTDGRLSWAPHEAKGVSLRVRPYSPSPNQIYSLWLPPEKSNAPLWTCGANGLLMHSTDGGVTWVERSRVKPRDDAATPTWFTLPPPLYYPAALALFIWMLSIYLTRPPVLPDDPKSANATDPRTGERFPKGFDPDKPVESVKDDTLNFREISEGLSRFLRNQDTKPPLSIAITGEWGSGKSSIMGMLKRKLEEHDCPVVWFNAWHHQKEASLLAALLQNLNLQAIWPWYSLKGIRLRLELIRRKLVPAIWIPAVLLACLFFGWIWAKPTGSLLFWNDISDLASGTGKDSGDAGGKLVSLLLSLLGLGGVGATGRWLWNAAKGLGVDPAKLVQDGQSSSLATSRDQISFRYQFSRDFARLTGILRDAFQTRITVFIDDLDRCEPAQVREILEAINFLVSSGDCFIVLGMDYQRVKDCVGQGFRESVVGADGLNDKDQAKRDEARAELNRFAQRYMEKLVNIVVPVPQSDDERLKDLVAKRDGDGAANNALPPDESTIRTSRQLEASPSQMGDRAQQANIRPANAAAGTNTGSGTGVMAPVGADPDTDNQPDPELSRRRTKQIATVTIVALGVLCYWGGHNLGATARDPQPVAAPAPVGETIQIKLWGKTLIVRSVDHLWTVEFEQPKAPPETRPTEEPDKYAYSEEAVKATTDSVTLPTMGGSIMVAMVPLLIALGWFLMSRAMSKEWVEKDKIEFTQSMRVWYPVYSIRRNNNQPGQRATPRSIKRFANRARYYAMRARRGVVSNHPEVGDAKLVALAAIDDYFAGISQIPGYTYSLDELWGGMTIPFTDPIGDHSVSPPEMAIIWKTVKDHQDAFGDTWPPTPEEVKFIRGLAQGIHLT